MSKLVKSFGLFFRDKLYGKYLLVTNTVSGGLFMLCGDFMQQKFELYKGKSKEYDVDRAKNMFTMGIAFGPLPHYIYKYLDTRWPKTDTLSVAKKITVDQMTVAPICIVLFFVGINLMEGKELNKTWAELRQKFLTVYLVDCMIWIPAQAVNFYFLPARYRVLYMDFILLGYDAFLSYIKYKDQDLTKQLKEKL